MTVLAMEGVFLGDVTGFHNHGSQNKEFYFIM
jgi:hypothetical protein